MFRQQMPYAASGVGIEEGRSLREPTSIPGFPRRNFRHFLTRKLDFPKIFILIPRSYAELGSGAKWPRTNGLSTGRQPSLWPSPALLARVTACVSPDRIAPVGPLATDMLYSMTMRTDIRTYPFSTWLLNRRR